MGSKRWKVGLSGNLLVKSNIPKSKYDNVFYIREDYSLKYEENLIAGFFNTTIVGKLWKFLGTFLWVPYFQNMIGWVPMTRGFNPYFMLGSSIFFPSCYSSF